MTDKNALLVEEQALYEQEQGLVQMEAQLHAQEQGVAQMERAFQKKNRALVNLASYVKEQEASLLRRAEAMGTKALALAEKLLNEGDSKEGPPDLDLGRLSDRQSLMHKRREQLSQRMGLIEEREALYAARTDTLDRAESQVSELEQKLVRRESSVSETARQVFSSSSTLLDEDDEEGDPAGYDPNDYGASAPRTVRAPAEAPVANSTSAFGRQNSTPHTESTQIFTPAAARAESASVAASESVLGESGASDSEEDDGIGGLSRAEDKATRKRANARARVRTNQFKITLEAHLEVTEPHHFFRYENDGVEDLPGLFIATPNLLKVGREVRIRVGRGGKFLEATGIVAWRRQRGDSGGVPGMGIELLNLSDPEKVQVVKWTEERAPVNI